MALELSPDVLAEVRGHTGFITLNRPKALNALSLQMVRDLMACLLHWQDDPAVLQVAVRGSNKEGPFGAFCAGGDIRFLREAALAGNPQLEDFFTEEYALNHLIHHYPKPYIAFMDGIVMGGGMGISQGAALRIVTDRTRMAMPETIIGLFPDVGGGYFLSRCPGRVGEFLALTGDGVTPDDAVHWGLADVKADATALAGAWQALEQQQFASAQDAKACRRVLRSLWQPPAPKWRRRQSSSLGGILPRLSSGRWKHSPRAAGPVPRQPPCASARR